MKVELTDKKLKSLKPKPEIYQVMDSLVRGFGVRVLTSGRRSFMLYRRFPPSKKPVRRTLGEYPAMSLMDARETARDWILQAKKGITVKKKTLSTFKDIFEDYLNRNASKFKSGADIEREMRRELKDWMDRRLDSITEDNVKEVFKRMIDPNRKRTKKRNLSQGGKTNALFLFAVTRAFFNWCVADGQLDSSPMEKLKPAVLIGERNIRDRVLKDYELAAFWKASEAMSYPFGKLYQLLALTALRRDEASEARWSEFDIDAKLWVIPGERMKNGAAFAVPLTPGTTALLESLPRFVGGDYVFTTTGGRRPVSGFSKAKKRLDGLMQGHLERPFVIQDIRRTCRTRFSALPIEQHVRELLLAHAQPGLHKVYDLHAYEGEKREGLELWHQKLKGIVA